MSLRERVGVPEGSPRITVGGVDMAYHRSGAGVPVLCLSAIGHGGADFADLPRRLGPGFEIIALDWPGHGRSGEDHQPLSPGRFAELTIGLIAALGLNRPIILGNSIGGAAAILVARQVPVRGLVLCDAGGLVKVDASVRLFCGLFEALFAAGARGSWWFPSVYRAYYRHLVLPGQAARAQRERIIAAGPEMARSLQQAWAGFGRPSADIRQIAMDLEVPIWVAWSRQDRVIPLSRCLATVRGLKHGTLTRFEGGHSAFLEDPEAFGDGFRAFARGL